MLGSLAQVFKLRFCQFKPQEIIDSYWEVEKKVEELAHALQTASHPIIFTGAGISTSVGIPDYRSAADTTIKTGPGLWNRDLSQPSPHETPIDRLVDAAKPSTSHMAIAALLNQQKVKHLISQNTDGLHVRSGIPFERISELHGNRNL
jgi:NAD-dependent SIR2 family protein deacetylase